MGGVDPDGFEQLVTASSPPLINSRYHTSYAGVITRKCTIDHGKVSIADGPRPDIFKFSIGDLRRKNRGSSRRPSGQILIFGA